MATYYCSPTGTGNGLAYETPCSLATGLGLLEAGDTLYLLAGTYSLTTMTTFATNGTEGNVITISGYPDETAILDGANLYPDTISNSLLKISGNYVTIRDFWIKNTKGGALFLWGDYDTAYNINCEHIGHSGIIAAYCTGTTIDNCSVTDNGWRYPTDPTWGSAIAASTEAVNCIIQNCLSYENTGEGFNSYQGASGTVIQNNIAYNNDGPNYYADSTTNATFRRNIGYSTSADPPYNFYVGAETSQPDNLIFINNLMLGGSPNLVIGINVDGSPVLTIAYNTFVEAVDTGGGWNMGVYFRPTSYGAGSIFKNNIVIQEAAGTVCANVPSTHTNLTFSYNCWSKTVDTDAQGTGDVVGDPKIVGGSYGAGTLTADYFKLQSDSPCIDTVNPVSGITTDYFGNVRPSGIQVDIGAHEYNFNDLPIAMIRLP